MREVSPRRSQLGCAIAHRLPGVYKEQQHARGTSIYHTVTCLTECAVAPRT